MTPEEALVCPACWHVMPADGTCPACRGKWSWLIDVDQRVCEALQASSWPLMLVVHREGPTGQGDERFTLPTRLAVDGSGMILRHEGEGVPETSVLIIIVDAAGQVQLSGPTALTASWSGEVSEMPPVRVSLRGMQLALQIKAQPRAVANGACVCAGPSVNRSLQTGVTVLGRATDLAPSDISIPDDTIQDRHLLLIYRDAELWALDLHSEHGTYVNGEPKLAAQLHGDDTLQVGRVRLLVYGSDQGRAPRLLALPPIRSAQLRVQGLELRHRPPTPWWRRLRFGRRHAARPGVRISFDVRELTIAPGQFIGIIGPSGIGKTTLLEGLAGLKRATAGQVWLGDRLLALGPKPPSVLGYVPQDDIIHRTLTVRQALTFAARLRTDLTSDALQQRVQQVIAFVGLTDRIKQRITTLSGGQRKRVNIAVELLPESSLLLLDEPAAGLDPAAERRLMLRLFNLSRRGQTVILTTHALASLHLLDRVIALARPRPGGLGPAEADAAEARVFNRFSDLLHTFRDCQPHKLFAEMEHGWPAADNGRKEIVQ